MRTLAAFLVVSAALLAADPRLRNAKVEKRSAVAGLETAMRAAVAAQGGVVWIGYAVPSIRGDHQMCCNDSCCRGCSLESRHEGYSESRPISLEQSKEFFVFYRVEDRRITKLRQFSPDCEVDGGGLTVFWLTDVKAAESVRYLASLADVHMDSTTAAIALHDDPAADKHLEQMVNSNRPVKERQNAAFWLGSARGRRGYEVLDRLMRTDPSDRLRREATFALSVSREPEALTALIRVAKDDQSSGVRGQALFWLAQKAGQKAAGAITNAIENDPETEVKKQAVFALTQMPSGEGVPLLIRVARSNRNPVVRKQAIFWLGQSNDPGATAFIEEILTH